MERMSDLELIALFPALPIAQRLVAALEGGYSLGECEAAATEYVAMADVAAWAISGTSFDRNR